MFYLIQKIKFLIFFGEILNILISFNNINGLNYLYEFVKLSGFVKLLTQYLVSDGTDFNSSKENLNFRLKMTTIFLFNNDHHVIPLFNHLL